jgi:hypothetical protein
LKQSIEVDLKWYHFSQNNSGGYFIQNDTVAEDVFIQATCEEEACRIASDLFEDYSDYCECCGERWSYYYIEEADVPSRYGVPITEKYDRWGEDAYAVLHHYDNTVTKFYPNQKEI